MSKGRILRNRQTAEFGMPLLTPGKAAPSPMMTINQDTAEIEREAYERGYEAGERAGYSIGEKKASMLIERLEATITELEELKGKVLSRLEPEVFNLSVAIAKKIIRDEIRQNPEVILNLIKAAMERMQRRGTITIKINPAIKELIEKNKPEILALHGNTRFETEPSLPPSGPLVTGTEEEVVTDVERLLSNLLEDLGAKIGNTDS